MQPILEFKSITKSYDGCFANRNLSMKVMPHSIHGLIGENGAGKSTAMKLLFGLEKPTSGEIIVRGQPVNFSSPMDALKSGIGMVHQHFMLSESHTALENLMMVNLNKSFLKSYKQSDLVTKAKSIAQEFGFDIQWDSPVHKLSVGEQQRIEILKLLMTDSEILILDEPTAVLTPLETQEFFNHLFELKKKDKTIIIITHKLKEVMSITDRVTVIRKGASISERETNSTSISELAQDIVGQKLEIAKKALTHISQKDLRLELQYDYRGYANYLRVGSGEIVGIAGIEGNGQKDLISRLVNPAEFSDTTLLHVGGQNAIHFSTKEIRQLNVGIFPEDRLHLGMLEHQDVEMNFILGFQRNKKYTSGFFIDYGQIATETLTAIEKFNVDPPDPHKPIGSFSGGNQQKIVVARELQTNPEFIIASQPTRGVDLGAMQRIHSELLKSAQNSAGVLLISSELDELLHLSDRIYVMYEGKLIKEFNRSEFNEFEIGKYMTTGGR